MCLGALEKWCMLESDRVSWEALGLWGILGNLLVNSDFQFNSK